MVAMTTMSWTHGRRPAETSGHAPAHPPTGHRPADRPRPRRLGHDLRRHHRTPAARTPDVRRPPARPARRAARPGAHPCPAARGPVVAGRRPRRPQHRRDAPCCSWRPNGSPAGSRPPWAPPSRCWSPPWPARCCTTGRPCGAGPGGVLGVAGVALVVLGPQARLDPVGVLAGLGHTGDHGRRGRPHQALGPAGGGRPAGPGRLAAHGRRAAAAPPTLAFEGVPQRIDAGAVGGYVWLGSMGGLIAYTLWFRGLATLPVGAAAPLVLLSPLVAAVIGAARGESLSPLQTCGFVLALAALLAAQLNPPHTRRRTDAMKPPMTIAVLGATGMVGSRIVAEAAARGHRVPALSRRPVGAHPGVIPVPVDAGDPDAVHEALAHLRSGCRRGDRAHRPGGRGLPARCHPGRPGRGRPARPPRPGGGRRRCPAQPRRPRPPGGRRPPGPRPRAVAAGRRRGSGPAPRLPEPLPHRLGLPQPSGPPRTRPPYRPATAAAPTPCSPRPTAAPWISAEDLAVAAVDELEAPGPDRHITVVHAGGDRERPAACRQAAVRKGPVTS